MSAQSEKQIGMRVAQTTFLVNTILTLTKLAMGLIAGSAALISDAVESAADVGGTILLMLGFRLAKQEPDRRHPYGHEKIESMVGIALALILILTAFAIGKGGIDSLRLALAGADMSIPGSIALVGALLSIIVPEVMYRYTIRYAAQIQSSSLEASAWHHRSDAFSSIGTLIGVAGARLGWPFLDPLAALVTCGFIIKVALDIISKGIAQTIDQAVEEKTETEIRDLVLTNPGVLSINDLLTRQSASKMFVDISIACDKDLTLEKAHSIAQEVHDQLERSFSNLIHCNVHVDPYGETREELPGGIDTP